MIQEGAHKYEFGDQGSILVIADDEEATDHVHYSYDGGSTWYVPSSVLYSKTVVAKSLRNELKLGTTVRSLLLTTIPDSTSQKFLLLGTSSRKESTEGRHALIFLDFAPLQHRQCTEKDFEKWYARSSEGQECLMGHKVSHAIRIGSVNTKLMMNSNGINVGSLTRLVMSVISLKILLDMRNLVLVQMKISNGKL